MSRLMNQAQATAENSRFLAGIAVPKPLPAFADGEFLLESELAPFRLWVIGTDIDQARALLAAKIEEHLTNGGRRG